MVEKNEEYLATTPPVNGSLITPHGNPLDWAPKKPSRPILQRQNAVVAVNNAEVEDFFNKWQCDLSDDYVPDSVLTDALENATSFEEKMANCEGCRNECGNQEAHYDGCLKSVVDNMY